MKPWKLAISLAVIGAISAPFVAGSWRPRPNASMLIPLTEKERSNLNAQMEKSKDCRLYQSRESKSDEDTLGDFMCQLDRERLADGGHWIKSFSLFRHVATNAAFMLAVFAIIYALVLATFGAVRKYFEWLLS
jgi:hypothetical protein